MAKNDATAAADLLAAAANDTLAGGDAQAGGDDTLAGADTQAGGEPVDGPVAGIDTGHQHPSLSDIRAAIDLIEGGNTLLGRDRLVKDIMDRGGVLGPLMDEAFNPTNDFEVTFLGITATSIESLEVALTVWCSTARRAILSGIYADEAISE